MDKLPKTPEQYRDEMIRHDERKRNRQARYFLRKLIETRMWHSRDCQLFAEERKKFEKYKQRINNTVSMAEVRRLRGDL